MSKIVRQVDNLDKISITIHTTLLELSNDTSLNLIGWIKGTHAQSSNISNDDYSQILLENRKLLKEKIDDSNTINYYKSQNLLLASEVTMLKTELARKQKTTNKSNSELVVPDFFKQK